ncbi:hypothetical protein [Azospirillum doebereinerae]|uniref:Uncharacterized protein n=1 Tax=Azospirillum doebereinerae TaxID=92933 RepID=A0A3S0V8K0_9PROT|nr:hypothetical protein [Azospirillum doebereinerae]RUQ75196.1 hypothetical protein EJ913_04940 [Azospirillum doebereinerae]
MAEGRSNWVVVTGLVRDGDRFDRKLRTLLQWRQDGIVDGIVMSTWIGEMDRYPETLRIIQEQGIVLVETEEPLINLAGHVLHQMKALHYGLLACPENAHILRLRPDLGELTPSLQRMLSAPPDLTIRDHGNWPRLFNAKIIIHGGFLHFPGYINDIIYYGERDDVLRLVNFTVHPEYIYTDCSPEQFFYTTALLQQVPILDGYMQVHAGCRFGDAAAGQVQRDVFAGSDYFLSAWATYLLCLHRYVRIGLFADSERSDQRDDDASGGFPMEALFQGGSFPPGLHMHADAQSLTFLGEGWLNALFARRLQDSPLTRRFYDRLDQASDFDFQKDQTLNPLRPAPDVLDFVSALREKLHIRTARLDEIGEAGALRYRIRGPRERVSFSASHMGQSMLEQQNTMLRRRVDELSEEVAAMAGLIAAMRKTDGAGGAS